MPAHQTAGDEARENPRGIVAVGEAVGRALSGLTVSKMLALAVLLLLGFVVYDRTFGTRNVNVAEVGGEAAMSARAQQLMEERTRLAMQELGRQLAALTERLGKVEAQPEVREALGRIDERLKGLDRRVERIEEAVTAGPIVPPKEPPR